ncbi:S-layer homology domain-containing protein [Pelotomaculum isophthalicicum JI]|uniref:S-layer homology domain-containing protein n=1 Tax=Pelotomaculum isophthalicicum JI TaxID=947010 RepID=A0A9X4H8W2_9FIRM|nr:S-layer homology domain-containing protein [Pelotomaculum isophthalicicum]MDF9409304.1 S-layer homology domain-containing protein [Pelotomaculum isophthalicicum JI]
MKLKFFGILLVSLLAVAIFSGGMPGVSVAADVYLPIPGDNSVSQWVYTSTTATKGWTKLSAISKSVEINFGKDNYLLFNNNISGEGINVILRDKTIFPTNDSSSINGSFAQSVDPSPPHAYINHTNDWIVKPLSPVYTIVPSQTLTASNGPLPGYSFVSPSTITLKYNSNISDSYETVSVLYRIDDNSPWEILPGLVNSGSKTVTATFTTNGFGSYCVVNLDSDFNEFSQEIASVNWSQQYVQSLWNKGIMSQTGSNGYFGLVDGSSNEYNTTRGEFASMLVKGMRLPLASLDNNIFSDVTSASPSLFADGVHYEYYYPQWRENVCTAASYGLFNGIRTAGGSLVFQPTAPVTREQAAALIARAVNLKVDYMDDPSNDKVLTALKKMYADNDDYLNISVWARPYVLAVSKAKYMSGTLNATTKKYSFNPTDPITRAETAKIIQKVLKNKKLI